MKTSFLTQWVRPVLVCAPLLVATLPGTAASSAGLWVGEVALNKVNEVSVPINAAGVAIAPTPTTTTPTKDTAYLRLLLHVDASGRVRLLKSVAVANKVQNSQSSGSSGSVALTNVPAGASFGSLAESNIVLLTDPTLYPNYPGIGMRLATASFDFSDLTAMTAVRAATPKANAAATAASAAALATGTSDSASSINSAVNSAAFAAALAAPASGTVDLASLTNIVNAVVAATVDQLNRVRAKPTTTTADRAKVEQAASDTALLTVASEARRVGKTPANEVLLSGALAAGGTVSGTFAIGDDHPTNPFRHKFHPDHQYGFEITRNITLLVNTPSSGSFEAGGYGVDRLTGVYKEEIFGLHKPLGVNQNVGLRTEGTFKLSRISLKDTLNQ